MIEKLEQEILDKMVEDNCASYLYAIPVNPTFDVKFEPSSYHSYLKISFSAKKWKVKCSCKESGGEIQENDDCECAYCKANAFNGYNYRRLAAGHSEILVAPKDKKRIEKIIKDGEASDNGEKLRYHRFSVSFMKDKSYVAFSKKTRDQILRSYYVREKLDGSNGIDIVRATINVAVDDDYNINYEAKYDCFTEIIPGQKISAKKITKARGEEEISLFDAFRITSDKVTEDENVYFEGADSMIDFMYNNEEFSKKTGFLHLLANYSGSIPENSLFLLYMYLLSEYPVIELLVKAKYYGLVFGLFEKVQGCYRRDAIKTNVDGLSSLLNQTTKGKAALSIPPYIGAYLNAKGASIDEYMTWASINEREPISDKVFQNYINSEAYLYINYYNELKHLPNIMKYGYTLAQASKYIIQQYRREVKGRMRLVNKNQYGVSPLSNIITLWKDYLEICEVMGIEAARFPKNILSVHDDVMQAKTAIQNMETDAKIEAIANMYSSYKSQSKYLTVVFPKCVNDFIKEGNEMHNCVGGYARNVESGYDRIFFIRKTDQPDKSYITAECCKNGLGQLFYRNNQPVENYNEKEFAKAVCKYILSKPWEPNSDEVSQMLDKRKKIYKNA